MKKEKFKPILIILLIMCGQGLLYLLVKKLEGYPVTLSSDLDNRIPFNMYAIIPYVLWYALLFIVPLIIYKKNIKEFYRYIYSYIICIVVSMIIFIIYPTNVIRPTVEATNIISFITKLIFDIDSPVLNCFPSLHCSISTLFILFISKKDYKKITRFVIILLSLIIIPSTLFIKQHVIVDAVGGIVLAVIAFIIAKKDKVFIK